MERARDNAPRRAWPPAIALALLACGPLASPALGGDAPPPAPPGARGVGSADLAAGAPRAAETLDAEDEPPHVEAAAEATVVASRLDASYAATASVQVLTREQIRRTGARDLPELLRTVLGVDVRRRGVEGVQADIGIRGADYNGTLVLVDGESVNDPQTNHHSFDLDVPLDAVERVEVLAGAAGGLYGSHATGGVVNVVTRGARLGRKRIESEWRLAHGTHSLDVATAHVAAALSERLSVSVDGARRESSGFREDTELSVKQVRVSGRYATLRGPVTLQLGYADRSFGAYAFYGTRFPNQREATRTRSARLSADLEMGAWTVSPSLALRDHADDFVLERNDPAFYRNLHDTNLGTARLVLRREALGGGTLVLGAEGGREEIASTNLGRHRRDRGALFLEVGRPFEPTRPGSGAARVGLRVDSYQGFGTRLSPYAAASVPLSPSVRLRGSVGTGFRVPTFTDLYYSDPQTAGNPDLAPERSWNAELGAHLDAGPFAVEGTAFYRASRNLIDYVRSSPSARFEARNVREAEHWGLEGRVELRRPPAPLSRLALQATWVDFDLARLSAAAGGATEGRYALDPLHVKWDLLAAATLPWSLKAGARVSYHARPSYPRGVFLVEGRLGWSMIEGDILEAYVEGDNLTNTRYEERPGVPLPGRTLLAGIHVTF